MKLSLCESFFQSYQNTKIARGSIRWFLSYVDSNASRLHLSWCIVLVVVVIIERSMQEWILRSSLGAKLGRPWRALPIAKRDAQVAKLRAQPRVPSRRRRHLPATHVVRAEWRGTTWKRNATDFVAESRVSEDLAFASGKVRRDVDRRGQSRRRCISATWPLSNATRRQLRSLFTPRVVRDALSVHSGASADHGIHTRSTGESDSGQLACGSEESPEIGNPLWV